MSDFYVGYLPKAPTGLARFVRKVIVALGLLAVTAALVLVVGQMPFANSAFEYGRLRSFEGVVVTRPFPTLLVARPGERGQRDKYSRYLLVAPGKHGADDLVAGFDGKRVRLQGQLIYREGGTMVEITPGSIAVIDTTPAVQETARDLGTVTVTGEIVDSKCYLGVMNPGHGKVHRDCAARCLSGGIPPIFVTTDGQEQFLLVGLDGRALGRDALREFIAEPIQIQGELLESGSTQLLKVDPGAFRHTSEGLRQHQKALRWCDEQARKVQCPARANGGRMHNQSDPLAAEQQFFSSLIGGDVGALDRILGDDFLLIDVLTGSEVKKPDLLAVLGSGQLKFEAIQRVESRVRLYGITAVITGRTQMSGRFGETPFTASSRYTHVFVKEQSQWRLVSAQGTQIAN